MMLGDAERFASDALERVLSLGTDASVVSLLDRSGDRRALAMAMGDAIARRSLVNAFVIIDADEPLPRPSDGRTTIAIGLHPGAAVIVGADQRGGSTLFTRAPDRPRASPTRPITGGDPGVVSPIEVAILGPTEIRGVDPTLRGRPVLSELVVYLALHPGGAATRSFSAAVWPDRIVPAQTIANRLSEARQLLGFAPDDRPRLRKDGDRHQIADVGTDWERFATLARCDDPESWRIALSLVRGRPLFDLPQGQWAVMEGFVAEIELAVVECGLNLGRALLRTGDGEGAAWAAQMALRCAPWDERLHRILMRAADAAGNRQGIDAALRHLALALEIDGDPLSRVHPQTAALYQRLVSTPSAAQR
jgi:hypothetical protein